MKGYRLLLKALSERLFLSLMCLIHRPVCSLILRVSEVPNLPSEKMLLSQEKRTSVSHWQAQHSRLLFNLDVQVKLLHYFKGLSADRGCDHSAMNSCTSVRSQLVDEHLQCHLGAWINIVAPGDTESSCKGVICVDLGLLRCWVEIE